jgi:hypothetical protein
MSTNLADQGKQLIESLKKHVLKSLATLPKGATITVRDLQNLSGLTIKSMGGVGDEVWFMGFVTLLIELMGEGKIDSEVSSRNTRHWKPTTKVWLSPKQ